MSGVVVFIGKIFTKSFKGWPSKDVVHVVSRMGPNKHEDTTENCHATALYETRGVDT